MPIFDEFWPSLGEVKAASTVFEAALRKYRDGNTDRTAIECACADVWSAARRYEHERQHGLEHGSSLGLPAYEKRGITA